MQNHMSLVKDVRGCMTRFDPLTPEIVSEQSEDGLTYDELKRTLEEFEMSIDKVAENLEPLNTVDGIVNDSYYVKKFRVSSKKLKIRTTI